ncbi:MAG: HD domain-containing protein [Candidatus Cloacimonetes bacterium]|nr:HD domain-containing protein [Candidatus Cloacimonadota bacterium]
MKWKYEIIPESKVAEVKAFQYFMRLKALFRQGWLQRQVDADKVESAADHSFGTAILALLLCPEHLDRLRVLEIALLHEAGECIIGDLTPADNIDEAEKSRLELQAAEKILSPLPDGDRLLGLWKEFEFETSAEGRFVRQLDKLEMGLQAEIFSETGNNQALELLISAQKKVTDSSLRKYLFDCSE